MKNLTRSWAPLFAAAALSVVACKKTEVSSGPVGHADMKEQVVGVTNDTQILAPVQQAAGDVIRNTADCEKVKEFGKDAQHAIADAEQKVQTSTGHVTLDSLKKQVDAAMAACGAN
jgi:hypothetical protein